MADAVDDTVTHLVLSTRGGQYTQKHLRATKFGIPSVEERWVEALIAGEDVEMPSRTPSVADEADEAIQGSLAVMDVIRPKKRGRSVRQQRRPTSDALNSFSELLTKHEEEELGVWAGERGGRGAFEGRGPQRRPRSRLGRRLEAVAKSGWGQLAKRLEAVAKAAGGGC